MVDLSDNPPQYVTLSYTCGEPRSDFELRYTPGARSLNEDRGTVIHVNGLDMVIAPNLSQALARLIHLPDVSLIWIDAICIHQQDLEERASQVQFMRHIFGSASRVLIWLGDDFRGEAAAAFDLLSQLADLDRSDHKESPLPVLKLRDEHSEIIATYFRESEYFSTLGLSSSTFDQWTALVLLLERRWFTRQWCLQEVLLAKSWDAVSVLCGEESFPWKEVMHAENFLLSRHFERGLSLEVGARAREMNIEEIHPLLSHLRSFQYLGTLLHYKQPLGDSSSFGSFSSTNVLGAPFDQLTGYSIISALCYLTRGKRTSDPRDLLYALIGLLENTCSAQQLPWQRIVPDYSRPAEDVLTELSVNIINESKWLGLFSMTWQSPAESSRIQLPSWAMKWSNERPWPLIDGVDYDASDIRSRGSFPKSFVGSTLILSGVRLGEIKAYASLFLDGASLIELIRDLRADCHTGEQRGEVLQGTLVAGTMRLKESVKEFRLCIAARIHCQLLPHTSSAELESGNAGVRSQLLSCLNEINSQDHNSILPSVQDITDIWGQYELAAPALRAVGWYSEEFQSSAWYQYCESNSSGRRVFLTTDNQLLGQGPEDIQAGDQVYVLQGALTPVILRKTSQDTAQKTFRLVGEAYVHGYMHGKAMERESEFEHVMLV